MARGKAVRTVKKTAKKFRGVERKVARTAKRAEKALTGIAQGVANTVSMPFGSKKPSRRGAHRISDYLNATHPSHLALPRAVGPYTVVRLTQIYELTNKMVVFSPELMREGEGIHGWTTIIGRAAAIDTDPVNGTNNCIALNVTALHALSDFTQVVPAAMTVQIMNPEAIQTTTGLVWGGVCKTQLALASSTTSWSIWGSDYIALMNPRVMSAAKLALRGVQAHAYPLNMSELSNFYELQHSASSAAEIMTTWNHLSGDTAENAGIPTGMTPLVFVNPSAVSLMYQVTVEYRVRFSLTNPAAASHTYHPPAPDSVWNDVVRAGVNLGAGVIDIADAAARAGVAVAEA